MFYAKLLKCINLLVKTIQICILVIEINLKSVGLVHFSDQKWNSQNYLFNLHIISSLVHIIKSFSNLLNKLIMIM